MGRPAVLFMGHAAGPIQMARPGQVLVIESTAVGPEFGFGIKFLNGPTVYLMENWQ